MKIVALFIVVCFFTGTAGLAENVLNFPEGGPPLIFFSENPSFSVDLARDFIVIHPRGISGLILSTQRIDFTQALMSPIRPELFNNAAMHILVPHSAVKGSLDSLRALTSRAGGISIRGRPSYADPTEGVYGSPNWPAIRQHQFIYLTEPEISWMNPSKATAAQVLTNCGGALAPSHTNGQYPSDRPRGLRDFRVIEGGRRF